MRGHGRIAAKIIQGGEIKIGDIVKLALISQWAENCEMAWETYGCMYTDHKL